jgi:formylglycine-generating enzyme required for sulfatase activity
LAAAVAAVLTVSSCGSPDGKPSGPDTSDPDCNPNPVEISTDMVFVDGGTFTMGCDDCGSKNAMPAHTVSLDGFYIGKYEVTQELWLEVTGNNPSDCYYEDADLPARRPVETVSWDDVQEFISKLNCMTGKNYRLPTEAEWEYAARGGANSRNYIYSGGNDLDAVAWHRGNATGKTWQVGGRQPNELGLYDMSGNVGEWVADRYAGDYYASSPRENPKGPSSSEFAERVYRGGTYYFNSEVALRVFYRGYSVPDDRNKYTGFRLARSK